MSRHLIHRYLDQVEQLLGDGSDLYVEQFKAIILSDDRETNLDRGIARNPRRIVLKTI